MLTHRDILHYGSIVAFKIYRDKGRYLTTDGLGSDQVFFEDYHQVPTKIFSKSQFLVMPTFTNDNKQAIAKIADMLANQNTDSKYKRCAELLMNLLLEYTSNIEVVETNLTTPITFNLTTFQLLHLNSSKFLSLNSNKNLGDSAKLYLTETPSINTEFKLANSLKYQIEGECLVYFNTPVQLSSVKEIQGAYPHLQVSAHASYVSTEPIFTVEGGTNLEIVYLKQETDEIQSENLRGGDLVMISQLDYNMMLQVENDLEKRVKYFMDFNTDEEEYHIGLMNFATKEYNDNIAITNCIWIVEHIEKHDGDVIKWKDKVRILSLPAQKYLCIHSKRGEQPYFYLGKLTDETYQSTLFQFISPVIENEEQPIKSNDYLSIKSHESKQFLGISPRDSGLSYTIEAVSKQKDEHTLKIMKSDRSSNEMSYFQMSTYKYLSVLLQELKMFKINRKYKESQILRKKLFPGIKLIQRLREFVNNQYLIASVKDKYDQRNPVRQNFLAKQQYILFCSMILGDIFDDHELKILDEMNEYSLMYDEVNEALQNKTDIEKLIQTANFRFKASNKIDETELMLNFVELIRAKIILANQIYCLLEDITRNYPDNQVIAYECVVMYNHHFNLLPLCSRFLGYLIYDNVNNSSKLALNFNYDRIRQNIPSNEKIKLDIVIEDPNGLMIDSFINIRPEIIADKITYTERRRQVNPLIYSCMLLLNSKSKRTKLKCIRFLKDICTIKDRPSQEIQDQIYRLLLLVPEIRDQLFVEFKIEKDSLYLNSNNEYVKLNELLVNDPKMTTLPVEIWLGRSYCHRAFQLSFWLKQYGIANFGLSEVFYSYYKGIFFDLFFNMYIDQYPLERISLPQLVRFISDLDYKSVAYEGRIRRNLNLDNDYPKDLLHELISTLVKDLNSSINEFIAGIKSEVDSRALDCRFRKEIIVPDLPESILVSTNLLLKLLRLNVLETFELYDNYTMILQICFKIFDFNQMMPSQFIFLQELKKKEKISSSVKKSKKKKGASLISKTNSLNEEVLKVSLLSTNYYLLKNDISNKLKLALTYDSYNDRESTQLSVMIFSNFMDLRLEFLLKNWTECVQNICDKFCGKAYSETEDEKLFAYCDKEVSTVFPPALKTSIAKADNSQNKNTFTRYVKSDIKETYDLAYLVKNTPGTQPQSLLGSYENVLPSILIGIITTTDEKLSVDLISLFLRMYSQRSELVKTANKSFIISSKTNLDVYAETLNNNKILYKMIEKIQYWGRNEAAVMEATDMIQFLTDVKDRLTQNVGLTTPTSYRKSDVNTQDIFLQAGCHMMVIEIFKRVVGVFQQLQLSSQFSNKDSHRLLLTVLVKCVDILREFIKGNIRMKNKIMKYIDDFMGFTRYNVGQSDLISDLFTNNPLAKFKEKKRIVDYFVQKIVSEGNQRRFLNYFEAIIDTRSEDQAASVSMIMDTFLPYQLPKDVTDSMKIIYGFINKNTGEHEMFLNDDFEAFKEDRYNDILTYKSEPFLFHKKLIEIYLSLMDSSMANIAKLRIRRYFTINYLIRLLSDFDSFFDPKYEEAVIADNLEKLLINEPNNETRSKLGITVLKPVLAELLFKSHCQGESNLYRSIVPCINNITNLLSRESERLQTENERYSQHYAIYLSNLLKSLARMYEMKTTSLFDPTEYDQQELGRFFELAMTRDDLLTHQFDQDQLNSISRIVTWINDTDMSENFIKIKEDMIINKSTWVGSITNISLERKAATINISVLAIDDVWQVANDCLKEAGIAVSSCITKAIQDETDVIAKALHSFDMFFDKDLKDKYGVGFKVTDFLDRIKFYLANPLVSFDQKHICLDFLMRYVTTSENIEITQNLLDGIGFTKTTLFLLSDTRFEDDKFSCKIIKFIISLLKPGNRTIQRSVFDFFNSNSNSTSQLFHHISKYFSLFHKVVVDEKFISGVKYDQKMKAVELLIELFQLLCENHFDDMQNYLRVQPNLRKRTNFLELICLLMKQCSNNPINKVYPLFLGSIKFLVEMLQGPCVVNQLNLVELNLVPTLTKILRWGMSSSDLQQKLTSTLTITSKSKLVKLKLSKNLDDTQEFSFKVIEKSLMGRFRMQNDMISTLKYKSIVLLNSMLEMMGDVGTVSSIRKQLHYVALKKLMIEVYVEFLDRYKGRYVIESLNHFDPMYMAKLSQKDRQLAEGLILETGFMTLFIILKLYKSNLTKNEEIKNDLLKIRSRMKYYQRLGLTNESLMSSYKKNEADILHEDKSHEHIEPSDFITRNANSIFEEAINFFYFYSSKIEIYRDKKIQEIYFIKVPYSEYLDDADKEKFNHQVDRSTTLNKVKALFEETDYLTVIMKFAYYLKTINFLIRILFNYESFYTAVSFLTAVTINIMIMISYQTTDALSLYNNLYDASLAQDLDFNMTMIVIRSIGGLQLFIGVRFLVFHVMKRIFMSSNSVEYKEQVDDLEGFKLLWYRIRYLALESSVMYYATYTTMAILGIILHPFFFAFHLYEIMNQFTTCRIFIQSIIVPWRQLILAFLFYNILIYEYAVLAYYFFWRYFVDSKPEDSLHVGHYCDTLYMCYVTVFDQTNKEPGGVGSYLDFFDENATFENNYRSVYDVTFKILVPIIMLSIVKGIIVDTFGALRELDQGKTEDMESRCFICGIERESFDKIRTKTFIEHIKESHNMWDYVHFLIYLNQKAKTELSGEEYYVYSDFQRGKYQWVPNKMCLQIDENEDDDVNQKINDQLDVIKDKVQKMKTDYELVAASMEKYVQSKVEPIS